MHLYVYIYTKCTCIYIMYTLYILTKSNSTYTICHYCRCTIIYHILFCDVCYISLFHKLVMCSPDIDIFQDWTSRFSTESRINVFHIICLLLLVLSLRYSLYSNKYLTWKRIKYCIRALFDISHWYFKTNNHPRYQLLLHLRNQIFAIVTADYRYLFRIFKIHWNSPAFIMIACCVTVTFPVHLGPSTSDLHAPLAAGIPFIH